MTDQDILTLAEEHGVIGPRSRVGNLHDVLLPFAQALLAQQAPALNNKCAWVYCEKCGHKFEIDPQRQPDLAVTREALARWRDVANPATPWGASMISEIDAIMAKTK